MEPPNCRTHDEFIAWMDRTPDSGVKMCHAQGKTAIYRTADGKWLVEHPPRGPITLQPFKLEPVPGCEFQSKVISHSTAK